MLRGALWIIVFLCLSMPANAQQAALESGLNKALNEIALELVRKLNRALPAGATLSVGDIGFRLDGDSGIVNCAPLSSNLENRLTDRLIDLTDDGEGVSFIKPPPGLSPDRTLVGFWENIDDESAGITFELRNTRDPTLTVTLDVEFRTLRLADLNDTQRKCVFDLVPGPRTTQVVEDTSARITRGPDLFGEPLRTAAPEEQLTVIRVAVVGDNRWAIVPVDNLDQNFGFVDCTFLTNCQVGNGPWLGLLGAAALVGGGVALSGGGGGGGDDGGITSTQLECPEPEPITPVILIVDFDGNGGPGTLPFTIERTDGDTSFQAFIGFASDDGTIIPPGTELTRQGISGQVTVFRPKTSFFIEYVSSEPAGVTPTEIEVLLTFDVSGARNTRGQPTLRANLDLGSPLSVAEKGICIAFATE